MPPRPARFAPSPTATPPIAPTTHAQPSPAPSPSAAATTNLETGLQIYRAPAPLTLWDRIAAHQSQVRNHHQEHPISNGLSRVVGITGLGLSVLASLAPLWTGVPEIAGLGVSFYLLRQMYVHRAVSLNQDRRQALLEKNTAELAQAWEVAEQTISESVGPQGNAADDEAAFDLGILDRFDFSILDRQETPLSFSLQYTEYRNLEYDLMSRPLHSRVVRQVLKKLTETFLGEDKPLKIRQYALAFFCQIIIERYDHGKFDANLARPILKTLILVPQEIVNIHNQSRLRYTLSRIGDLLPPEDGELQTVAKHIRY